jgi:hypothetical protein
MKLRLRKLLRNYTRSRRGVKEHWYESSDCCGAGRWNETDICMECREHAEFIEILQQ